jgi:hypothetical protein
MIRPSSQTCNNGRTDAILIDRLAALEYAKKAPKTVAAGEAFSRQESGIALRKGEPELLAAVNKALDELRADGTLRKLSKNTSTLTSLNNGRSFPTRTGLRALSAQGRVLHGILSLGGMFFGLVLGFGLA